MRGQRGATLIEMLVTVAFLGMIVTVITLNVVAIQNQGETDSNDMDSQSFALYRDLRGLPISSLNMTELQFVVDYSVSSGSDYWGAIYQNQIIITKLDELSEQTKTQEVLQCDQP